MKSLIDLVAGMVTIIETTVCDRIRGILRGAVPSAPVTEPLGVAEITQSWADYAFAVHGPTWERPVTPARKRSVVYPCPDWVMDRDEILGLSDEAWEDLKRAVLPREVEL